MVNALTMVRMTAAEYNYFMYVRRREASRTGCAAGDRGNHGTVSEFFQVHQFTRNISVYQIIRRGQHDLLKVVRFYHGSDESSHLFELAEVVHGVRHDFGENGMRSHIAHH